jgi:hypothetical protein
MLVAIIALITMIATALPSAADLSDARDVSCSIVEPRREVKKDQHHGTVPPTPQAHRLG